MRTEEEMRIALSGLEKTDILATHESPYHLMSTNRAHSGFLAISDYIMREHVPLHIFGHHHIDHIEQKGVTKEVCIYGCSLITTDPFSVRKIL
jgi:Icc-related predicted phosphoesterase